MANKYLDCCLEVGDNIRPFIRQGNNGKNYLYFRVTARKDGADKYGKTHALSIRYKATDGQYYTQYIGDATEKEFQVQQAPAPQGGYAPQGQYNQPRQYNQAPPQGYAPQGGYAPAPQAPAQPQYAPQNLPPQNYAPAPAPQQYAPQAPAPAPQAPAPAPQAPAPTFADAPMGQTEDDLPFGR